MKLTSFFHTSIPAISLVNQGMYKVTLLTYGKYHLDNNTILPYVWDFIFDSIVCIHSLFFLNITTAWIEERF